MSCEKDEEFIKEVPNTFYTLENAFSTASQVDAAIVACYQHTRAIYNPGGNNAWTLKGKGTDVIDVPLLRISNTLSDYSRNDPEKGEYNSIYSTFYQLISKANTALFAAELEQIQWGSEEEKSYAVAQAKFFRAFAYRNLGQLYGGVPIVDEIVTEPRFDFVRSTRIETYQFAIDDLESILSDLPETTVSGGRIVRGVAQHFLSELYLSMGIELEEQGQNGDAMYDQAIQYADELIDGGIYSLMTERFGTRMNETPSTRFWDPGTADVYWDLFQEGNVMYQDGNSETIWAFPIDFEAWQTEDGQSSLPYIRSYGPVFRWIDGFIGVEEDGGGRGVAFVTPTMFTRDDVWEGPVGENDMRNAEHNFRRIFYYNDPNHPNYGEVIPYSEIYRDDNFRGMIFPVHMKINTDKVKGVDVGNNYDNLFRDDYVVRLAETILLRAEAHFRRGNLNDAADDINMIRDRAQADYQ
ncbi:MAG: RagB/SusD family nutrient uptake outer membrane protein, partial [Bacteroidales bacterium]